MSRNDRICPLDDKSACEGGVRDASAVEHCGVGGTVPPGVSVAFYALVDAIAQTSTLTLSDVGRVEAYWEILDCFSSSHGFVIQLRHGHRLYLERLIFPGDDDEPVETQQVRHMSGERYPQFESPSHIDWIDDVRDLNRFFNS